MTHLFLRAQVTQGGWAHKLPASSSPGLCSSRGLAQGNGRVAKKLPDGEVRVDHLSPLNINVSLIPIKGDSLILAWDESIIKDTTQLILLS